jgi:crotonobetainyl-CoA:carnitine CoA-transferase CaiB-like acyl-CoA transferase
MHVPADCSTADRDIDTVTPTLPLTLGGARPEIRTGAPSLGAHTDGVLRSLGYRDEDLAQLRRDGVIG